jgi:hypothetical protein
MKATLIIALLSGIIITAGFARAEEIQVGDIGSKVIIIGKLGKPLGTVVTVEGQLISEPKLGKSGQVTAAFRVNKVDGKALEKAQIVGLIFRASAGIPPLHAHEIVHLSGYESGAFIGTPNDARDMLGRDSSPFDWKFETTIHVIKSQAATVPKS